MNVQFVTKAPAGTLSGESLASLLRGALRTAPETLTTRYASLTVRERQVLLAVVAGRMNKQIAHELGISEVTVKVHRAQVMRKMQAGSLAELVAMTIRLGDFLVATQVHAVAAALPESQTKS